VILPPPPPPPPSPLLDPAKVYAVGTGEGVIGSVTVYNPNANPLTIRPYDAAYSGGIRVAVARFPGGPQVITAPGAQRFPDVRLFNATTGQQVNAVIPFERSFIGGVNIAVGDLTGDGYDDYVLSPDQGGGPRVQIRDGNSGQIIADFLGIDDPAFRGGARAAIGDVNGDGRPDLLVAAGFGGGPRVALFDGHSIAPDRTPTRLVADFFVFENGLRNGVFLASGDVDGDRKAEIVAGAGPGGAPRISIFSGSELIANNFLKPVSDFFAGNPNSRGGVRVTTKIIDGDSKADLVVGAGVGDGSSVTTYSSKSLVSSAQPAPLDSFDAMPGFTGGVFVG